MFLFIYTSPTHVLIYTQRTHSCSMNIHITYSRSYYIPRTLLISYLYPSNPSCSYLYPQYRLMFLFISRVPSYVPIYIPSTHSCSYLYLPVTTHVPIYISQYPLMFLFISPVTPHVLIYIPSTYSCFFSLKLFPALFCYNKASFLDRPAENKEA